MGSSNEDLIAFGPVISPCGGAARILRSSRAGSSGASAAAVAARLCFGRDASDTGGSIRQARSTSQAFCHSRHTGAARAGHGGFRLLALDQAGTHRAQACADRRSAFRRSMAGHDYRTRPPSIFRCRTSRLRWARRPRASDRNSQGDPPRWHVRPGNRKSVALTAFAWIERRGRDDHRDSLPHTRMRYPAYYIPARRISPARWRALRPARPRQGHRRHV